MSNHNASSNSMAGVGRAGFIRDPSGLLMSIIRQLAASEDVHQRELEKERLEEAFKENDERLDELVADNYEELAISIKQFGKIGERISDSRSRIRRVREDLQQCKSLLFCRQDELRKLWVEGVEYKNVLFLLDQIESVKNAPQMVESYLSKKYYLHATELITQTLKALRSDLTQVEALHDIKNELISKKLTMHERFITELHRQIYITSINPPKTSNKVDLLKLERKSSGDEETKIGSFDRKVLDLEDLDSNPEEDPFKLMSVLVESLARLQRIPDMVEATKSRLDRHINTLVTHTTVEVTDNAFHDEDKASDDPKRLLQLLSSLFRKFRCVTKAHNHVLTTLNTIVSENNLDVALYCIDDVWAKIQSVLQLLLNEYLDADNVSSQQLSNLGFTEGISLSSHFSRKKNTRPRVAKLFRFDGSSHAISMSTYQREQRAQRRAHTSTSTSPLLDHSLSTQKVCRPNPRNITLIFGPLKEFIAEIEGGSRKKCSLHDYITDYVQDVFIRQIQYELKKDFDTAMKVTDPLKVLADATMQKEIEGFKNILQSSVVADQCIWFLYDLTCSLDSYHDHFLTMACSLLQEYKEMSIQSYRGVVQPESEDQRIVSASWVRDPEVNQVICNLDNWTMVDCDEQRSPKKMDEVFTRESQFFVSKLEEEALGRNSLIEDPSNLCAIASLHESLEWMTGRVRLFIDKIKKYAPEDTMEMLVKLAADYKRMGEICLLCLHIELRLLCFYHLSPMFRNNNYDIRGLDSMEHDFQVSKLSAGITAAEEDLNSSLQPKKFRYIFEGLGHQVAAILIGGAKHISRMSPSGVKKMCRNVFALQQLLTNITESRESHLDTARQFYEMLYLCPDDLQAQVVEQGVRYGEDDYIEALKLLHRSKPRSGNENTQWARTQRLRAIVREQTYKKEHAQAMERLALEP